MQVDDLVLDAVASDALDEVHKGLCCNTGIAENLWIETLIDWLGKITYTHALLRQEILLLHSGAPDSRRFRRASVRAAGKSTTVHHGKLLCIEASTHSFSLMIHVIRGWRLVCRREGDVILMMELLENGE